MLLESDDDFNRMHVLLQIMMTFSTSTAACKHGLSCMNKQKTTLRATLPHSSLNDIIRICIDRKEISNFDPAFHMKSWMNKGTANKHVMGHESPSKKVKDTEWDFLFFYFYILFLHSIYVLS